MSSIYCLDTSVFIHAWNSYPPRLFPCLWRSIGSYVEQNKLFAPNRVYDEFVKAVNLGKTIEPSFHWLKSRKGKLFIKPNAEVQGIQQAIVRRHQSWALNEGNDAEPWVIALAEAMQAIVISNESWPKQNEPKIPSVCKERNVERLPEYRLPSNGRLASFGLHLRCNHFGAIYEPIGGMPHR